MQIKLAHANGPVVHPRTGAEPPETCRIGHVDNEAVERGWSASVMLDIACPLVGDDRGVKIERFEGKHEGLADDCIVDRRTRLQCQLKLFHNS